jgi:hypothetical protein
MLGNERNFNIIETQPIINLFPARQCDEGSSDHSDRSIRGTCSIVCTVKNWVAQFKRPNFYLHCAVPCLTLTMVIPAMIDQIQELILEDGRISAK